MRIGMVGLGKMGGGMTERLLQSGHEVVAFDRDVEAIDRAVKLGAIGITTLEGFGKELVAPRAAWIMVPAGEPTESTIRELSEILSNGDTIIDGGNSNYKDTIRRAKECEEKGIFLVDAGTSGGVWGLTQGYSLMVGGEENAVNRLRPIFEALAPAADRGWGHVGDSGAGHFVKMVHNGIEYGLMQAYAEGFEILKAKESFNLDLHQIAEIWRFGSVVRSWLLDLTANALEDDQELSEISGWVADSGEGRWTVAESIDLDIPAPVITLSLLMRFVSRQEESYAAKILAAMRNQFGGHAVKSKQP
jgi:6-phosphogluconate dehydrogenase